MIRIISYHCLLAIGSLATAGDTDTLEKMVWRSENACGVNALTILLRSQDIPVEYATLNDTLVKGGKPFSLSDLKDLARQHGMRVALGKTNREGLSLLRKPIIAHYDILDRKGDLAGHFVVVVRTNDNSVTVVDGTTVEITEVSWSDFQRMWSGYVLYIDDSSGAVRLLPILATLIAAILAGVLSVWIFCRRRKTVSCLSP